MEYRILGKTGIKVSRLGFGGAPLGLNGYLGHEDRQSAEFEAQALAAVREALARGVTYFDTAPGYGEGRSEALVGRALGANRDDVFLATKFFILNPWDPGKATEGLRASLDRLRTDHVDLLQIHGTSYDEALADKILDQGVLDWMDEMQGRGLCRFKGLTAEFSNSPVERLVRSGRFDALMTAYSLIYQGACDYQREPLGIIPLAKSLGLGILSMRSATSGFLQKLMRQAFPALDTGELTRLALNFVFSTPEVDGVLVGMTSTEEVIQNCALASNVSGRLDLRALHDRYS